MVTGTQRFLPDVGEKRWQKHMTRSQKGPESPEWAHLSVCGHPHPLEGERAKYSWAPRILQRNKTSGYLMTTSLNWKQYWEVGKCPSPVSSLPSQRSPPHNGLQPAGHFSGGLQPAMGYWPQSHQLFPAFSSWQQATAFNLQGDAVARSPRRQSLLPSAPSL